MNPHQFLKIISHGKNLQKEDFQQLVKLHETFPYFQIPKLILAKYEFAKTTGNSKEFLHWAAVASPDRVWLKSFLEDDKQLEKILINLKHQLESDEKVNALKTKVIEEDENNDENLIPDSDRDVNPQEGYGILKKNGEDLQHYKDPKTKEADSSEESFKGNPKKEKEKAEGQDLMENIKKKAKKEILDEKKKEQIDLIKSFSKREFKLATLKELENSQKQDDLSKTSTQLNPSLISEPYAKLLLNQGKKHKAKEIYRKLMMKFPDKSSYFAELLKELEDKN